MINKKEVIYGVMKRYPQLNKVWMYNDGISYNTGKAVLTNDKIDILFDELFGEKK